MSSAFFVHVCTAELTSALKRRLFAGYVYIPPQTPALDKGGACGKAAPCIRICVNRPHYPWHLFLLSLGHYVAMYDIYVKIKRSKIAFLFIMRCRRGRLEVVLQPCGGQEG